MRLYLSSFRMGNCSARLAPLVRGAGRVAVIANAMDAQPEPQRREGVEREMAALASIGLNPESVDLRDFFDRQHVLGLLKTYDLLWLRGGNVFMLRYALRRSGADEAIVDLLTADAVVYGGYRAGPCVLGGSIAEFADVDDPSVVSAHYGESAPSDGLGILPWVFVPHVDSPGHPETAACGRVAERCVSAGIASRRFRDGEVLVIDGTVEHFCSKDEFSSESVT
jgi:dipeptidase E